MFTPNYEKFKQFEPLGSLISIISSDHHKHRTYCRTLWIGIENIGYHSQYIYTNVYIYYLFSLMVINYITNFVLADCYWMTLDCRVDVCFNGSHFLITSTLDHTFECISATVVAKTSRIFPNDNETLFLRRNLIILRCVSHIAW